MPSAQRIRILNVDDAEASRYMISRTLRKRGFDVDEAATGTDGLLQARTKPDLIVLDVQLPDISGLEVCERIKADPATASIPVLQISATLISGQAQAMGLEGGAEAYLTHPIDPVVLIATVKSLLRTKQAEHQLKETVRKLELERQLREQFVATLTHDLRTPLSAAKISAQLLGRNTVHPARHPALIGRIVDGIDRADQMISNLLDANRIKAGERLPLQIEPAELTALVREAIDELTSIHGDRFVLRASGDIHGYWSGSGIQRLVENLGSNAVKYGAAGAPVTIKVDSADGEVAIAVRNEGPPLGSDELAMLFQPFHRSSAAHSSGKKGWGLGLTLVRGIAEAHGGRVEVGSSEREGTTFRVILPRDCRGAESPTY